MKQGKKLLLVLVLLALAVSIFPISAQAAEPQYQLRVYPGNKGTISGSANAPYSVTLPYGRSLTIPDVTPIEEYYVKGIKESGKDSFMTSYYVTQDQDFIVVYGLKGNEVR